MKKYLALSILLFSSLANAQMSENIKVSANAEAGCNLAATDFHFGEVSVKLTDSEVMGGLTIQCSKGYFINYWIKTDLISDNNGQFALTKRSDLNAFGQLINYRMKIKVLTPSSFNVPLRASLKAPDSSDFITTNIASGNYKDEDTFYIQF